MSTRLRRRDRARSRARWALSRTPSRALARHYGITESGVRRRRITGDDKLLAVLLEMIADPEFNADPVMAMLCEAYEDRHAGSCPDDALKRLLHLREVEEHRAEAEQNRATVVRCPNRTEAYRYHATVLLEMAALDERGLER